MARLSMPSLACSKEWGGARPPRQLDSLQRYVASKRAAAAPEKLIGL